MSRQLLRTGLGLSKRKRLPLIILYLPGDAKSRYYFWQIRKYFRELHALQQHGDIMGYATDLGLHFTTNTWLNIAGEWSAWIKCYTPSLPFTKDSLVLDAGAGEGETVFFFYMLGFRRFRCIELNPEKFRILETNTQVLRDAGCELENRPFTAYDVIGVDFAKIDVEGGERELLNLSPSTLPKEVVLETHGRETAEALRHHLRGMTHSMNWGKKDDVWGKEVDLWRFLNKERSE